MKKVSIKILILSIVFFYIFTLGKVYAKNNLGLEMTETEYSESYKEWLNLSEEERAKTMEPRKYDIITTNNNASYLKKMDNVFKIQQMLKASVNPTYDLRDDIPENVKIRNQKKTNSCWTFATLGALESHLGLEDKKNSRPTIAYDFSESHMDYSTVRTGIFTNNEINKFGYTRELRDGGNIYMATQYLANGLGAVDEEDFPFIDRDDQTTQGNTEKIDFSEIQNQEVKTTLYDTAMFDKDDPEIMQKMKQHIINYGGLSVRIHGSNMLSGNYYNNATGAIYCDNSFEEPIDHAVVIIGWDDNYSIDNFNENQRPKSAGAWIIKNSWGEYYNEDVGPIKEAMFDSLGGSNNWTSVEDITDEDVISYFENTYGKGKVSVENGQVVIEQGNKGYMYISYEDCNVYYDVVGIEKATYSKDFDNVYQNDELGPITSVTAQADKLYLANVFTRDSSIKESLDKISVYTQQEYVNFKVFVNPNGNSKSMDELQEIKLKGDIANINPGYHTIEFEKPITLTGDSFVVVIQVESTTETIQYFIETKENAPSMWQNAIINEGESFLSIEGQVQNNVWLDLAKIEDTKPGNLCIKAYTVLGVQEEPKTLTEIYIENGPTKTVYTEGENFDKSGMKVMARYSDNSTVEITNYTIVGGTNLTTDTTSITIQYTEDGITRTTTQNITVNKAEPENPGEEEKTLTGIYIENGPTKTVYTEGENFDKSGMKVMARYSDNSTVEITNYTIVGGTNLTTDTTSITIQYTEDGVTRTTTQNITVNKAEPEEPENPGEEEKTLTGIYIENGPTKTVYTEGENFDATEMKVMARYSDNSTVEITNYTIVGGTNLTTDTTSITIQYTEDGVTRTTTQNITVNEAEPEEPEEPEQPTVTPVPSNFDNAKSEITDEKIYYESADLEKSTTEITIKISGIAIGDENNTYMHYYHISGTKGDKNITDWKETKINKESDGTYSITLNVSSNDLANINEISDSDNLYVYIREVAQANGEEIENIYTLETENNVEPEFYVDGEFIGGVDEMLAFNGNKTNNNGSVQEEEDNTVSSKVLPFTGSFTFKIIVIVAIIAFGGFAYYRYKNIDK